jgi:hypothetical protein
MGESPGEASIESAGGVTEGRHRFEVRQTLLGRLPGWCRHVDLPERCPR